MNKMKNLILTAILLYLSFTGLIHAQATLEQENTSTEIAHSILPHDGVITYLPKDSSFKAEIGHRVWKNNRIKYIVLYVAYNKTAV